MKKLIDWVLFTSSYTACCATGLCMATERLINDAAPPFFSPLHIFIFGCTLVVYNVHHGVKKLAKPAKETDALVPGNHAIPHVAFSIAGLALAAATLFFLNWKVIVVCVVSGFVSFAYSLPILPFKNVRRIRQVGLLKIFDLAIVWTVATSVLPILFWNKALSAYPYEILLRFSFLFTLCVLFDIRDVRVDGRNNVNTIPNMIGLRKSYVLINMSCLLFIGLSFAQYLRYGSLHRLCGAVATAIVLRLTAEFLKKHHSERAYIVCGDGVMLIYALMVVSGKG